MEKDKQHLYIKILELKKERVFDINVAKTKLKCRKKVK